MQTPPKPGEVKYLIEIPGVFDGWSAAAMLDGTYRNRWDPEREPRRHQATEKWLDDLRRYEEDEL